jgi:DNA-binding transcriptional MocR family regulator
MSIQYFPEGDTARAIVRSVEGAIRDGSLRPGDPLPPIRALATRRGLSPGTIASAYRQLAARGIVGGHGRGGTRVRAAPPLRTPLPVHVPSSARDLLSGGPDPELLASPLETVVVPGSYGRAPVMASLRQVAEQHLGGEGIDATHLAVVGGALDGVERVLTAWTNPGAMVAMEDPGYAAALDLLAAMGMVVVPVATDDRGARPESLERALALGCDAVVLTPRAQNPTGAAWDHERASELAAALARRPEVLVVEDDHAGPIAGTPAHTVCAGRERWATVRSVSKWLGPDFRLAVLVGDAVTVSRVEGRQSLGTGWVSHVLQGVVGQLWTDPATEDLLHRATVTYTARREALRAALAEQGVVCTGRSGLTTWVAVDDEHGVTAGLLRSGWAVLPGERFRIAAPPGIRIAFATLAEDEAPALAADLERCLRQRPVRAT